MKFSCVTDQNEVAFSPLAKPEKQSEGRGAERASRISAADARGESGTL